MMMYHHTKFGHQRLSGSEDISLSKAGHTDRWTDRWTQGHSNSSLVPLNFVMRWVGGEYNKVPHAKIKSHELAVQHKHKPVSTTVAILKQAGSNSKTMHHSGS